jgi:hypothetical protein
MFLSNVKNCGDTGRRRTLKTIGGFSALAFKLLPGRLPAGTAKFEYQRAAQTASVAIGLAAGTKSVVLRRFYHTLRSLQAYPPMGCLNGNYFIAIFS